MNSRIWAEIPFMTKAFNGGGMDMKKIAVSILLLAGLALAFSCAKEEASKDKETIVPGQETVVQGETVSISARLSDVATKVNFDPSYDAAGKTTSIALTWADTDKLLVVDHANPGSAAEFTLTSGAGEKKAVFSGTLPAGAASYDVSIVHGDVTVSSQTQPADGDASGLQYFASKTGLTDLSSIEFDSVNSVLAITAKMPADVAGGIKSVDITASENIFGTGNSLTITLDEAGDAGTDDILHLFATLPEGDKAVPAGTTLLVHFNAPGTEHTVYTRFIELGAQTFTAGKCNTININASASASHAGLPTSDGSNADKAYLIGDKYQLLAVDGLMVAGATKYFKLLVDLDMTGEEWAMLNNPSPYDKLIDFDGNNKTISHLDGSMFYVLKGTVGNLTLDNSSITAGSQKGALAQYIQGAGSVVTNVDVHNCTVGSSASAGSNAGGLIGRINSTTAGQIAATITDCDVINTGVKAPCAGGVLGSVESKVIVSNCSYSGNTVQGGTQKIGGFAGVTGDNLGCTFTNCRVENATVDASGISGDARAGGFIGQLGEGSRIEGCTVGKSGEMVLVKTGSYDATNSKKINSGGFVGVNYGIITKDASSNHCKAYVHVTSTNTEGAIINIGGFAGFQRGTISYSDAVVSMGDLQGQGIGGFCGYIVFQNGKTVLTDHCTVVGDGDPSTVDIRGNNYSGGFVGIAESGDFTISNCHVLEGTVVIGQSTAGGFAAQIKSGIVEDCSAHVDLQCRGGNDGGFVGALTGGTVRRCTAAGTISQISSNNTTFGGFAGYVEGADLTKCSSTVNINVARSYLGGLIGSLKSANTVSECFYDGTISGPTNTKGGLIGTVEAEGAVITNCYTAGELIGSSGTQIYGGIVGELKTGASVTNCYSVMDFSHAGRATGGIVGRACNGGWNVSTATSNTISKCIAWNPAITYDGTPSSSASSGAIVGYTSFKNILSQCYRRSDMVYKNSNTAVGTTCQTSMVDQPDCDGTNWGINGSRPSGTTPGTSADAQYQAPYYGVAAAANATVSSIAQALGWSSDVWDFSGELPTLK